MWVEPTVSVPSVCEVSDPGKQDYSALSNKYANILRTGDIKFQANLEYRPAFGAILYGALFLDAGNVWMKDADFSR